MFESTGWVFDEPKVPDNAKFDLLVPSIVRTPNFYTKVCYKIFN